MPRKKRVLFRHSDPVYNETALRFALTYIGFLLVCLALGLVLCIFAADTAEKNYWSHHSSNLSVNVSHSDTNIDVMERYARQLSTDPTFVRFCGMQGLDESDFVYTAYQVRSGLIMRLYGLSKLPIISSYIYMPNSQHVISASQFTRFDQFYNYYLNYPTEKIDEWVKCMSESGRLGSLLSLEPFSGEENSAALVYDISSLLGRNISALVWFELDTDKLKRQFLPEDEPGSVLLIDDHAGAHRLVLSDQHVSTDLIAQIDGAEYDASGMAHTKEMQLIRRTGEDGWHYTVALPRSMCRKALGNYVYVYGVILALAVLFGLGMVFLLVRSNMRPFERLHSMLLKVQGDKDLMQREMDAQRPLLHISYLRRLLSGHIATDEEFDHIMQFLDLRGHFQFFVLYCNAYLQDDSSAQAPVISELLPGILKKHLTVRCPMRYYPTPGDSYVVLVAYDADDSQALDDLRRRVHALHDDLAENHSIWFFAGVGSACTQARLLWESYEQARTAARYTAKNYVFLPYSHIRKDPNCWYYPVEISAKLLHFITSGNTQQVTEMFALIRRENLEERSLSAPLLNYLLSDLKNTLLKARFQIPQQPEAQPVSLSQLDEQLAEANTFTALEHNARTLCSLFTHTAEPADQIEEIRLYIQENFADPSLCLSKLSGLFNISESYLSHLFKDRTGQNFSVYLEELRMNEAVRRLKEENCNLSTLYADLGYTNAASWRRAFKKHFGVTPSEMRQSAQ